MPGQYRKITAADGSEFQGYVAVPESGKGPGLVLIQEIFGVNQHIRDVADRYAQEGYVVLAPDIFFRMEPGVELGYEGADFEKALGFYERYDEELTVKDIADSVRTLRSWPECTGKVGALGYCLGGKLAMLAASRCGVDAAVSYYGVNIEQRLDDLKNIKCPVVMHFGETDELVPPAAFEQIKSVCKVKENIDLHVYPGVGHGFNCAPRASYNREAAELAYSRTLDALRLELGLRLDLKSPART